MTVSTKRAIVASIIFILAIVTGIVMLLSETTQPKKNESDTSSTNNSFVFESSTETKLSTTVEELPSIEEQLEELVQKMTLDEKIGQLFLVRVPMENQLEDISTYHLGGYLLFSRDIEGESKKSLTDKIKSYQDTAKTPFMVASDEEGGMVTRISRNREVVSEPFKSPQMIYAEEGMAGIGQDVQDKSAIFKELGIHTGLYPVADVSTHEKSFIYSRTIGLDVEGTSTFVKTVVEELTKEGIGSTLKHFPGYGDNEDSHTDIVHDRRSRTELEKEALPPFKAGIEAGADSILVSHTIVEALDETLPASISPTVHDLLRTKLGFEGVVMTDDMDMAGLADFISQEEAGLQAVMAGNDLILSSSYKTQIPAIKAAITKGDYTEDDLNQSVKRIIAWKHKLGIIILEE